jgi:hypothetical protein
MPSCLTRNRQWGRGFCGFGDRWGVDMRFLGCFEGFYFGVKWAGAVGRCPIPTHDDEAVMNGAPRIVAADAKGNGRLVGGESVEGQVQVEDVDAGFAQQAELALGGVVVDEVG